MIVGREGTWMLLLTDAPTERREGSKRGPLKDMGKQLLRAVQHGFTGTYMLPDAACTIAVIPLSAKLPLSCM